MNENQGHHMSKLTRDRLAAAAKDMNDIMGLEPAIDTEVDDTTLKTQIIANAVDVEDKDKYKDDTWKILGELDAAKIPARVRKKLEAGKPTPPPKRRRTAPSSKPPAKKPKDPPPERNQKKEEPPKAKKKTTAPVLNKNYSRSRAAAETILKKCPAKRKTIMEEADKLWVKKTGKPSTPKAATVALSYIFPFLEALGVIEEDKKGRITIKGLE